MADELELLRRANPVPVDGPHFGDGPLDHHAERHLDRLLHERPSPPRRRTRLAWGLAATTVVAALVSALLFTGQTTAPAVAAPRPLLVQADSTPVSLKTLAERARAAAADGAPKLRKGTHVQSWSLGMSDDKPPITLPEERIVRWNADDSHTEIVVATDPRHPGRPVLDRRGRRAASGRGRPCPQQADLPAQLERRPAAVAAADRRRTPACLPAGGRVQQDRADHRRAARRRRVAARHLDPGRPRVGDARAAPRGHRGAQAPGQVTDRLGRRGQAYVYDGSGARRMLIMDPATGAVLGLETTFTQAEPEYGVKAGDVMSYSAWMR